MRFYYYKNFYYAKIFRKILYDFFGKIRINFLNALFLILNRILLIIIIYFFVNNASNKIYNILSNNLILYITSNIYVKFYCKASIYIYIYI